MFRDVDFDKMKENIKNLKKMEKYLEDLKDQKFCALEDDLTPDMDNINTAISHLHSKITEPNYKSPSKPSASNQFEKLAN